MRMTKIRKNQLCNKLKDSRCRLMDSYPFFAILLMYLRFVAVDNIRNISTNGRCIFFNADFVSKLYPNELDFILCHQVMHIINGDIWRSQSLEGDDFHWACDIYNNDQMIGIGWRVSRFTHLGKLQYQLPLYNGKIEDLSTLEIFKLLPYKLSVLDERARRRYLADTDYYWDYKNDNYVDGILILDVLKMTKFTDELKKGDAVLSLSEDGKREPLDNGEELEDFWSNQVRKAGSITKEMGNEAGTIPGGIKRDLENDKKRVVDWRKVLDEFVQEEITDYSFTPPDRRYTDAGFFLPDFNERDFVPKDILFMADTSGSVSKSDLSRVYDEISGAIEQFDGKLKGRLGFFDYAVTEPIEFENVDDIRKIIPYGGGGTSFNIIFEYIREWANEFLPAMIVIFTDGYAAFPEKEAAMNIPVLWLISNEDVTPPWGKVGRVL